MELNDEVLLRDNELSGQQNEKPNARRVEDENNLREENLEINLTGSNTVKPVQEGTPMGGHNFGGNNNTSAANEKTILLNMRVTPTLILTVPNHQKNTLKTLTLKIKINKAVPIIVKPNQQLLPNTQNPKR